LQLGYVISLVWSFAGLFVALWIFDQNILGLGVTWVSVVVAFSFLFGSSATNFFEVSATNAYVYVLLAPAYTTPHIAHGEAFALTQMLLPLPLPPPLTNTPPPLLLRCSRPRRAQRGHVSRGAATELRLHLW
jgi:hypothetical protein